MPKIIAFTTLDGASFWVKNAKRKHLLAFKTLNGNALTSLKPREDEDPSSNHSSYTEPH